MLSRGGFHGYEDEGLVEGEGDGVHWTVEGDKFDDLRIGKYELEGVKKILR